MYVSPSVCFTVQRGVKAIYDVMCASSMAVYLFQYLYDIYTTEVIFLVNLGLYFWLYFVLMYLYNFFVSLRKNIYQWHFHYNTECVRY